MYRRALRGKMENNKVCWTMQAAEEAACCLEFPEFEDQVNFACLVASARWVMQCSKLSRCTKHDVSSHWCMKLKRCGLLGHPQINQTWFSVNLHLIILKSCKIGKNKKEETIVQVPADPLMVNNSSQSMLKVGAAVWVFSCCFWSNDEEVAMMLVCPIPARQAGSRAAFMGHLYAGGCSSCKYLP